MTAFPAPPEPYSVISLGAVLLVTLDEDIDDASVARLMELLANEVRRTGARGVVFDLHQVEVVDSYLAGHLESLAALARNLDARAVVAGLGVPTVLTVLDFGIRMTGLEFALDVQDAVARFGVRVTA
ncbi:STAS domain-containing protein [Dissulfurirhabdus thermomarina]|uniref:STAS domain-containing protein n=1 Tax=Dissulfurirhabdus thermomarina TaxID=1765737 RepID=A0A6N9TXG8_DISTH|nr:STAS domain-containing protein [Dissulfurirhabdus thermomarina]NDY43166.1 STAS domain-containing protein [Dissulfurirhabdus thermomarina]NMX22438.1 STAS domain-containing protein [Dissulfurirhabdus thermomarina]